MSRTISTINVIKLFIIRRAIKFIDNATIFYKNRRYSKYEYNKLNVISDVYRNISQQIMTFQDIHYPTRDFSYIFRSRVTNSIIDDMINYCWPGVPIIKTNQKYAGESKSILRIHINGVYCRNDVCYARYYRGSEEEIYDIGLIANILIGGMYSFGSFEKIMTKYIIDKIVTIMLILNKTTNQDISRLVVSIILDI